MKVLVTGANGQLAQTFREMFEINSENITFSFVSKEDMSITDRNLLLETFSSNDFDYCINCAAYTNVDGAETDVDAAYEINDKSIQNIIDGCLINDTTLIHISTDYVFDGKGCSPYKENHAVYPVNVYGKSKLNGERRIISSMSEYFIIRTSWLYSAYGKNFAKSIAQKIKNNAELTIITSQKGVPTSCVDLSNFIFEMIKTKNIDYGIYHFSPNGETTWYGFAKQIASNFPQYDINNLKPIDSFNSKAKRPDYSVMDNQKASQIMKLRTWEEGVDEIVKKLKSL
ncbi:dTDP-4-dehydrorhamnose reductase [Flavobacteriaceae bacterium MAR_2010_188]|nr:dTDP-4-dehydrorhamnose reductase [Flavobacteriaceae bacterium MAR_2010_188]